MLGHFFQGLVGLVSCLAIIRLFFDRDPVTVFTLHAIVAFAGIICHCAWPQWLGLILSQMLLSLITGKDGKQIKHTL